MTSYLISRGVLRARGFVLLFLCMGLVTLAGAQEYTIGPRDVLKITVWGHDDLSKDYQVDGDGLVPFPLIGRQKASGLTVKDFAARLTAALEKDYLVNPQVMVVVKDYLSRKVHVLGEAEKPGLFYLTGPTSLLEALSKAGGLAKNAGKDVVLVRQARTASSTAGGGNTILRLDLNKIQAGDPNEDVSLEDGDTIFIPKSQAIFVLGEVQKAGTFSLAKETSVLEAITLAGGFNDKASPSGVKILRRTSTGGQETISVDLSDGAATKARSILVQDGDTIVVPKGNTYFVFGAVNKPGAFFLHKRTTILEAVTVAGGFTQFANPGRTRVMRATPEGEQVINVNMYDVIRRGQMDKAIELQENDVVIVP